MVKYANYLSPQDFYGDGGFLDWIVRLDPFHENNIKPPMSSNQFYWASRIQYGCALKVTEMVSLVKSDFDLDNRILTVRKSTISKNKKQFTTIMPYDANWRLERFLTKFSDDEKLFPISRTTLLDYYKNSSLIWGKNMQVLKKVQKISGAWTHLLRESCAKMYVDLGAKLNIITHKLRLPSESISKNDPKVSLKNLLDWEELHLHAKPHDVKE